jgi:hypothetical protein
LHYINHNKGRHHPRKRVIQFSRDFRDDRDVPPYWIARSSRAMTVCLWRNSAACSAACGFVSAIQNASGRSMRHDHHDDADALGVAHPVNTVGCGDRDVPFGVGVPFRRGSGATGGSFGRIRFILLYSHK